MPPTCTEIFQAMPGRFNCEAAGPWETLIQFNISGADGGLWYMEVKGGKCDVQQGTKDGPKATVLTDTDTWVGIMSGTLNPVQAFMTGKIKVQGNMMELMKLNNPAVFKRG